MTEHVRTSYRKHPRAAWMLVSGILLLAALALAIVIPAFGAPTADTLIPPAAKPSTVVPILTNIGGSNFSCTTNVDGMTGLTAFQVSNPPQSQTSVEYNAANTASTSTPLPAGVKFTLSGINGPDKGKVFAFKAEGGVTVFYVGVKGGTDTARYKYAPSGVSADGADPATNVFPTGKLSDSTSTGLHSTKSSNGFNVASIATFCYARTTTISGRVYLDNDGDAIFDSSGDVPDTGRGGWTLTLYDTSSSTQLGTKTSSSNGTYQFDGVPIGSTYKVCATPPSGAWFQTVPTGNTACSSPALPAGQQITTPLQGPATGKDFGVEPTVTPSCDVPFGEGNVFGSGVEYSAQLSPNGTACKTGDVVMYTYNLDGTRFATLHPASGSGTFKVVEHIRWRGFGEAQNPVTLWYDDDPPYDGANKKTMLLCKSDPRTDPTGDPFVLPSTVSDTDVLPTNETSCMLRSTDSAPASTDSDTSRAYDAWIYSNVDGTRGH